MNTLTDEGLLSLLQLSDSFFPLGGYSLSFGLETYSQLGFVKNADDVSSLLSVFLEQLSTLECPAIRASYAASRRPNIKLLASVDRKLASYKNVKEFYEASRRMGRTLIQTVRAFKKSKLLSDYSSLIAAKKVPGTYAVCLAICCGTLGIDEQRMLTLMVYTSAISMLGAAVRLGRITHIEAQQILHSKKEEIRECLERGSKIPWDNARAFSPQLDVLGMQHVYLPSRMFSC